MSTPALPDLRIEKEGKMPRYIVNTNDDLVADLYADSITDFGVLEKDEIQQYGSLMVAAPAMARALLDIELLVNVNCPINCGSPMHLAILKVLKQAGVDV